MLSLALGPIVPTALTAATAQSVLAQAAGGNGGGNFNGIGGGALRTGTS